jgi:hypothetical protein
MYNERTCKPFITLQLLHRSTRCCIQSTMISFSRSPLCLNCSPLVDSTGRHQPSVDTVTNTMYSLLEVPNTQMFGSSSSPVTCSLHGWVKCIQEDRGILLHECIIPIISWLIVSKFVNLHIEFYKFLYNALHIFVTWEAYLSSSLYKDYEFSFNCHCKAADHPTFKWLWGLFIPSGLWTLTDCGMT